VSHEQVYVQDMVKAATEAAAGSQITGVKIEVGELAPIHADDIKTAMEFTGWALDLVVKPGTVRCKCGYTGQPNIQEKGHDYTIYSCPACGGNLPPVIDGKDVILKDVVVQDS
jgi:Zn finger protein HypA/HybF involved in hydrogenase expression